MVYDELMKSVEAFDNEELRDAAMKVLRKVPEKDWEEFDITGLDESEWRWRTEKYFYKNMRLC